MKSQKASRPKSDPPAVLLSSSDPAHLQRKMQEVQVAIRNGRHCGVIEHTHSLHRVRVRPALEAFIGRFRRLVRLPPGVPDPHSQRGRDAPT